MSWRFEIIDHGGYFGLHETHFNLKGEIVAHTDQPSFVSESAEGIKNQLSAAFHDVKMRPALIEKEIVFGEWDVKL